MTSEQLARHRRPSHDDSHVVSSRGRLSASSAFAGTRRYPLVDELAVDGACCALASPALKFTDDSCFGWMPSPTPGVGIIVPYRVNVPLYACHENPALRYRLLVGDIRVRPYAIAACAASQVEIVLERWPESPEAA